MNTLQPHEIDLLGKWIVVNGKVVGDETCERIEVLIAKYLKKVTVDKSGWETLYQDAQDRRYWELTYPQGEMHGGGPPRLTHLANEQVREKYSIQGMLYYY